MKILYQMTRFLWIFAVLFGVGLLLVLIIPWGNDSTDLSEGHEVSDNVFESTESGQDQLSFEEYEKVFSSREMFQSTVDVSSGQEKSATQQKTSVGAEERLKEKYRIVGIVIDKNPEVVFEDITTTETFFLSSGETLGEAVIQDILPGKVVLAVGDSTVIMTP